MTEFSMLAPFDKISGSAPFLINVPHAGTELPESLRARLRPEALELRDTDWHMALIAREILPDNASLICARPSRYLIDLNRPLDDEPLYAGATTGLMSTIDFDGNPLYLPDQEPGSDERAARIAAVWEPYHAALAAEIDRIRNLHGYCLLLDMHSIRSQVPRLFEGQLPDLNLGSNSGASAASGLVEAAFASLQTSAFTAVCDGRFKGGYITRHYGQPARQVHALQIEIAQCTYMQESPPWTIEPAKKAPLKQVLSAFANTIKAYVP